MVRIEMDEVYARYILALAVTSENFRHLLRQATPNVRRLKRKKQPWDLAYARFLQAGIARRCEQRSRSCKLLRESDSRFDACDTTLNAVVARRCLGEMIVDSGGDSLLA